MTKTQYLILITMLTAQVYAARDEQNICEEIKSKVIQQVDSSQICHDLIQNHGQYDGLIFSTTCDAVMARLASDVSEENVTWCKEQFKPVTQTQATEGDQLVKVPVDSASPIPPESVTTASVAMDKCQEDDLSKFSCPVNTTFILPDLNSIMNSPIFAPAGVSRSTPAVYTKAKCDCFEKSVNKTFSLEKRVKFDIEFVEQKKRVNELIFNAAGKKIINAFAANLEDINFYKTNNVQAIGGDKSADELQCNNTTDFKSVIMAECNKNQINASVIKSRTESLLGAFGDFKDQSTIEGKFKQLQDEVLNANLDPSKLVSGGPKSYSRHDYDKTRFGIYQKRDEVKFMSELTDAVMDDPDLSKIIEQELTEGRRPGHAIFKLVSDESNQKVKQILSRIVRNHKDEGFYKNLGVTLKTTNQDDLRNLMMSTYDLATDMHPGLKAIFRSPELFRKTHAQMEKNNNGHDLIAELDRDPELLKTFFQKRCEGLKAQFAEALCYREQNLTDRANKEDLNKLLSTVSDQISPVMKDAILCRMPDNDKNSNSVFSKLSFNMGDKLTMADYFKRKVNVTGEPASRFERFAMEFTGGGSNSRYLSEMSDFGSEFRKPSAEFAVFDQVDTNQKAETISMAAPVQTQEKTFEQPQTNQSFSNNYVAPVPQVVTDKESPASTKDQRDPRSMLRDFLSDEENKSEIDRHLSNLSPKDQEELARLKEEIAADKDKILALLQESERLKLRGYEKKVTEAESKLARPQVQPRTNTIRENDDEEEDLPTSTGKIASSPTSTAAKDVSGASSASSSVSGAANGRGSSGAQRSLASLNSALPTAVNNFAPTTPGAASDKGEIIIQSSGSEDVSKEVISFVQKTEPDVETLKQLKSTGMTFKYKVVENGKAIEKELKVDYASLSKEARQFLDQKIAVKEAKRNYSYNTLRLMLGLKAQKQL